MSGRDYSFLNKEILMKRSKMISSKIETMTETFDSFLKVLDGLKKIPYLEFQYLFERSGLTEKLLEKLSKALETYRDMYFQQLGDIQQTSLKDFGGNPNE